MQKKLNNNFATPQETNVSRIGRKVMLTGDIEESSIHELMRLLFEIENEDNEYYSQEKVNTAFEEFAETLVNKSKDLDKLSNTIDKYQSESVYDREPIELYISSFGGSGYDVISVIDQIENLKAPVHTYLYGKAMSAGFLLFMVGCERFISRNSTLMLHQLSGGIMGTIQDMKEQLEEYERMQQKVEDLILLHTYIDEELLEAIRESKYNLYLDAEEAIEYGVADHII
jgi:ATP-dependent Clp protease protease subunit